MGSSKISTLDLEEPVVEVLNTIDTVADQLTVVDTNVNSIKTTVEGNVIKLDTINTNCANLNSRLTDARAGYLDYLNNSTYGLNALKTAIGKIPTTSGGGLVIGSYVGTVSSVTGPKTFSYPVFIYGGDTSLNGTKIGSSGVSVAAGVTIKNDYNDNSPCYVWKLVSS